MECPLSLSLKSNLDNRGNQISFLYYISDKDAKNKISFDGMI